MPRRRSGSTTRLAGFAVAVALLPAAASAQPLDLDTPADSPLWWTLTDDISPQQLRDAYRDPGANRRRFREAVAAGLQPPAPKDPELRYLVFYVNPRLTPELEPLWSAFYALADQLELEGAEAVELGLAARGISAEGIDRIVAVAQATAAEVRDLVAQIGPLQREFILMVRGVRDRHRWSEESEAAVESAVERGDTRYFAEQTGRTEADVARLLAAGLRTPTSEAAEESIVRLKADLAAPDWRGLRRYLFDRAASGIGGGMNSSG
jgi:hypothetical protein